MMRGYDKIRYDSFCLGYNINIVKSLSSVIEWLMPNAVYVKKKKKKKSNMIMCSSHKQWVHLETVYGNVALVL